ncbi:MAG: 1-deoxy-D-xylulose-5-phosphate synthase [Bacteroidetes bacterium]|nr:1-deoxy-D-xylulose-5-phosphate synthase [Bacteroidota bacterium]
MKNRPTIPLELQQLRETHRTELEALCAHYRQFIIDEVLQHGGHFSANLGTIELTVALHYVLNTPEDQLVWDVGHQAYLHKVLTGRKADFGTIRKKDGLSGFPRQSESEFDVFGTGHSSTSISAVLGLAEADKLRSIQRQHIAVIGDGSLTGGMAWEALNNAAHSHTNILIVINDNQMGIDPNAGALNQYLNDLKDVPNFFTDMGFTYYHTSDGHDIDVLVSQLKNLTTVSGPKIWHVKTVKGKGYKQAENEQTKWHSVKYVKIDDVETPSPGDKFQDVFGHTLLELARSNKNIVGITPAMPSGCSMKILMDALPEQCFDVGIAEQHAITFSAGLATNGMIPFCNIYSTFFQRGLDQFIHDVCLQNLPVIFCLDRAGVVGEDGATHHGVFDISLAQAIPNCIIMAPANNAELRQMMYTAVDCKQPVIIRYPKGSGGNQPWNVPFKALNIGESVVTKTGKDCCIIALGTLLDEAMQAAEILLENDVSVQVINARFVKPLDTKSIDNILDNFDCVVTVEDGAKTGGFGSAIVSYAHEKGYNGKVHVLGYPDEFIDHASREELLHMYGLDADGIASKITSLNLP